jgi:hypothetical protein
MIQAQLKSNFSPTFLLSFKKETDVEERESLQLEREREFWLKSWAKVGLKLCLYQTSMTKLVFLSVNLTEVYVDK